jgi:urease accessory protein
MNTLLLLLLDSRAPAGAHHHSGGMEAAAGTGLVTGLASLEDFCRARLRTSARVAAGFAAASARAQAEYCGRAARPAQFSERAVATAAREQWELLDAEFEARTPSEAMRTASRQQGGTLVRLLRSVLPEIAAVTPWTMGAGPAPHHPLVLGAGVALAGGTPELAGRAAALAACAGPASAAVRLLGLDPFAVQGLLARLAPEVDACAEAAATAADGPVAGLAADAAPALDVLADYHLTAEVRLFAS